MKKIKCEICGKEYSKKGIGTHIWRAHGDGKNHDPNIARKDTDFQVECEYCNKTYNNRMINKHRDLCVHNPINIKRCLHCNRIIEKRYNKFCNSSCAALYSNQRVPRKRGPDKKPKEPEYSYIRWFLCEKTGKYYSNRNPDGSFRKKSPYLFDLDDYRVKCKFEFDVFDYPEEFDFSLVEQYGWYSPTNKGNNLSGISRDHMLSISYGYKHDIDPEILSHPANCELMLQRDNVKKRSDCSISLEELQERIIWWDKKYN